jgi:hypothetical protein
VLTVASVLSEKAGFVVAGGVLVVWAIIVSAIGINRPDFPGRDPLARLVMLVSVILVAAAITAAILTS